MKIKELHLVNFGKFTNKKIELDDELNIIYGENEAGKSTVFHFIVGMFYGFYKPYVKNRRLLEIHETYNPWSGGGYSGSLLFFDDISKRDLRLERNFAQGKEYIKVFVESSGDEITDEYDIHPIYRLPDIAAKHIGVSYATFVNTLAIKQLGHETDENLDKELKETVVNALSTHNIDVSVNKVQDKITKELDAIGSGRRKTSAYYLNKQRIVALTEELGKSSDIHAEILSSKDEGKDLELDKTKALEQLKLIELIEASNLIRLTEEKVSQGRGINKRINDLKTKQKDLSISDEFSVKELESAIEKNGQLEFIKHQLEMNTKDISDVEAEISQLKGEINKPGTTVDDETLEEITKDIYECTSLKEESNDIAKDVERLKNDQIKQHQDFDRFTSENDDLKQKLKQAKLIAGISLIILITSAVLMNQSSVFIAGAVIGIAGVLVGLFMVLSTNQKLEQSKNDYENQINELKSSELSIKTQQTIVSKKTNQVTKLLHKYKVEDIPSLISLKDKWLKEQMAQASMIKIYDSQLVSLEKLRDRRKSFLNSNEVLKKQQSELENKLRPITSYYQTNSIDELKQVKDRLVEFLSMSTAIANEELRLKDLLAFDSLEVVEEKLLSDQAKLDNTIDKEWLMSEEASELLLSKAEIKTRISDIDQSLAGIHSKSEALSRGHRRVSEVEEELVTEKANLENLDFNKKVYELIGETIGTITDELQHNFAPLLNESVSKMVETITDNKYQDIKINPQMLMRLKDPESHQMINANQLSRGTMDLFYLALRDALATWVNGDKELPVLLDETFAHFDDQRLSTALNLFSKSGRQVILFTCQKREVDLSKAGSLAKVINL